MHYSIGNKWNIFSLNYIILISVISYMPNINVFQRNYRIICLLGSLSIRSPGFDWILEHTLLKTLV